MAQVASWTHALTSLSDCTTYRIVAYRVFGIFSGEVRYWTSGVVHSGVMGPGLVHEPFRFPDSAPHTVTIERLQLCHANGWRAGRSTASSTAASQHHHRSTNAPHLRRSKHYSNVHAVLGRLKTTLAWPPIWPCFSPHSLLNLDQCFPARDALTPKGCSPSLAARSYPRSLSHDIHVAMT